MSINLFGQRLSTLRKQKGVSQKDLSKKTGLTPRTISFYEIEEKIGFVDKILRIAKALEVPPSELFNFLNQKNSPIEADFDPRTYKRIKKILLLNRIDRAKIYEQIDLLLQKDEYKK
ncbi:MAG: helix-turn-helix transcriptional regulator [Spirochaetes bacterium]|nr:helix-turn-helix transcriptional regulator [Candidatus Omnitrophota bacterium]MCK5267268.1 helix-turn-helix transcriptional regulator [Spirochaetota bacterium]